MSYNGKNINDDAFVYNHKSEIEIDKTAYGYITGTITVMYDGKDRKATPRKDDERVKLKP
jgi:hypothetical protein